MVNTLTFAKAEKLGIFQNGHLLDVSSVTLVDRVSDGKVVIDVVIEGRINAELVRLVIPASAIATLGMFVADEKAARGVDAGVQLAEEMAKKGIAAVKGFFTKKPDAESPIAEAWLKDEPRAGEVPAPKTDGTESSGADASPIKFTIVSEGPPVASTDEKRPAA